MATELDKTFLSILRGSLKNVVQTPGLFNAIERTNCSRMLQHFNVAQKQYNLQGLTIDQLDTLALTFSCNMPARSDRRLHGRCDRFLEMVRAHTIELKAQERAELLNR